MGRNLMLAMGFCLLVTGCGGKLASQEPITPENYGAEQDVHTVSAALAGLYHINLANGAVPHEGNDFADVDVDEEGLIFTMPFCPEGSKVCDSGYSFLPFKETKVFSQVDAKGQETLTFVVKSGEKEYRYSWLNAADGIHFRNYQYRMTNGEKSELEHVLVRSQPEG